MHKNKLALFAVALQKLMKKYGIEELKAMDPDGCPCVALITPNDDEEVAYFDEFKVGEKGVQIMTPKEWAKAGGEA